MIRGVDGATFSQEGNHGDFYLDASEMSAKTGEFSDDGRGARCLI